MNGVIADEELFLRHPERHAADILDKVEDDTSHEDVEGDDEEEADDLDPDLVAVALDTTSVLGDAGERGGAVDGGEDTSEEAANDTGDHVGMDDTETVVNVVEEAELAAEDVHADPGDATGQHTEEDGRPAGDEACRGRDGDKTRDHAVDGAENGRLLVVNNVERHPGQQTGGGTYVGIEDGDTGIGTGIVRITTIEAVPAEPEDAGADEHEEDVVRAEVCPIAGEAGSDPVGGDEAGGTGRHVDDVAAGVVENAHLVEEATPPDAEGADGVGQGDPQRDEDDPGEEVHAGEDGTAKQDDGDGCEDELEVDHRGHGVELSGGGSREVGLVELVVHLQDGAGGAYEGGLAPLLAEAHVVGPDDPADQGGREGVEDHEGRVDGPLAFDDAGVQDHEAWQRLEADEGRCRHLPGIIAMVHVGRIWVGGLGRRGRGGGELARHGAA